MLHLFDGRIVI